MIFPCKIPRWTVDCHLTLNSKWHVAPLNVGLLCIIVLAQQWFASHIEMSDFDVLNISIDYENIFVFLFFIYHAT